MKDPHLKEFEKTKIQLMMKGAAVVFYSTILFSLKHSWTKKGIPTAATDGLSLFINPDYFMSLNSETRIGLMVHEVMHVALGHMLRRHNRDPELWNRACISLDNSILMADNTYRQLQDIRPGDYVQSPLGANKVIGIAYNGEQNVGLLNSKLKCTANHKVLTNDKFIQAQCCNHRRIYIHTETQNETSCDEKLQNPQFVPVSRNDKYKVQNTGRISTQTGIKSRSLCEQKNKLTATFKFIWKRFKLFCRFNGWRRHLYRQYLKNTKWTSILTNNSNSNEHIIFPVEILGNSKILWGTQNQQFRKSLLVNSTKWLFPFTFFNKVRAFFNNQTSSLSCTDSTMQRKDSTKQTFPTDQTHADACYRSTSFKLTQGLFRQREDNIQPVFDLITEKGAYIAEGIVVHNCDYVINLMLRKANFELPSGGLIDDRFEDMDAETAYDILFDEAEKDDDGNLVSQGIPGTGADLQAPPDPAAASQIQNKITDMVISAQQAAESAGGEGPGSIPGAALIELKQVVNPKLPWHQILANYMMNFAKNDYSWSRPNRRYVPEYYLPTVQGEACCNLIIAVDASGSALDAFAYYISEIEDMKEMMQPDEVTLIVFDTEIRAIHDITKDTNLIKDIKFTGGGGTDPDPVLEYIQKKKPEVALIFTDGEFYMPERDIWPTTPVIWIIDDDPLWKAPFGKTIHYDLPRRSRY